MVKKLKRERIKKLKQKRMNFKLENPPIRFRKDKAIDLLHPQEGVTDEEVEDLW